MKDETAPAVHPLTFNLHPSNRGEFLLSQQSHETIDNLVGGEVCRINLDGVGVRHQRRNLALGVQLVAPANFVSRLLERRLPAVLAVLRKVLNLLSPVESMELIIDKLSKTASNGMFLSPMSNGGR